MKYFWIDGSVYPNPNGDGGWGAFGVDGSPILLYGHATNTTNNRMELQALISILQFLNGAEATIYMDSEYVLFGATKWLLGWKAKDWDKVKNFDLWQAIDLLLSQANVHLLYTAGHAGEAGNELAHKLANYSRINKAQSAA